MLTPKAVPAPQSCDTFVYIQAPSSKGPATLFGKNSDRPSAEHHEVVRIPHLRHKENEVVHCTYIGVPQASETLECVLSRPSWLWGCEMGANSAGVVGGNEAIHTLLSDELFGSTGPNKSLLGMDLLRIALERGTSAKHAVEICIHFLEKYGQGGPCCKEDTDWSYENSFLFADANEAFVLETAGKSHWAWERIGPGEHRNISNGISIRSNWGAVSNGIQSLCQENGWWDGTSKFDWKRCVGAGGSVDGLESCGGREAAGSAHLKAMKAKSGTMQKPSWWIRQMAGALRDEDSGICFRDRYGFCSTGSQISWLPTIPANQDKRGKFDSHFFTGASDPLCGTPYKLLRLSEPSTNEKEGTDNETGRLWDLWRSRALDRVNVKAPLRDELSKMEEEGLTLLENDEDVNRKLSFAAMVQREIELLEQST
mmetsp:Transcript_44520/g.93409  ORF Transcript_44520/g.93409 Transcript_44520/m.93409 type:complete len:426 (+) Transcript_44520:84-1361(+)